MRKMHTRRTFWQSNIRSYTTSCTHHIHNNIMLDEELPVYNPHVKPGYVDINHTPLLTAYFSIALEGPIFRLDHDHTYWVEPEDRKREEMETRGGKGGEGMESER